ncbi:MAG TPA: type II toxin-antitoxin system prevent-host-death family antitoxin [Acetobacteraceae bacterium]|nr:type II toxin-antitoxin system prevent-host-death family antitoxin [Acetobacteraceae bacterium]
MRAAGIPVLAALGPGVSMNRICAAARVAHGTPAYADTAALLAEALGEHLTALARSVEAAEAAADGLGPEARLERLLRAWIDSAAAAPDAHRAFLFCTHALPAEAGRGIELYRQLVVEQVEAALAAAVPAYAACKDAPLAFHPLIRHLLSDPNAWPVPPEPEARRACARRFAGMLIAAAEAEAAGYWLRLGAASGGNGEVLPPLAAHLVRENWAAVLHDVSTGREFLITRHGRPVARIVPAAGQKPPRRKRRKPEASAQAR